MKKVIIVGASSGIGWELAKLYSSKGFEVGITARRLDKLQELKEQLPNKSYVRQMDVGQFEEARATLIDLVEEMQGMDILVLNAGLGDVFPDWKRAIKIIDVNATGFTVLADYAFNYFKEKGGGQLAGTSSVMAIRGSRKATVYGATKAYISTYMYGLRNHAINKKFNISVTDIRPGFIRTPLTEGNKGMFWVVSADKAVRHIYKAIDRRRGIVYVPRRWRLVAWLNNLVPDWLYYKA